MLVDAALINLLEVEKLSHVKECIMFALVNIWTKRHKVHTAVILLCCVHLFYLFNDAVSNPGYVRFTVTFIMITRLAVKDVRPNMRYYFDILRWTKENHDNRLKISSLRTPFEAATSQTGIKIVTDSSAK
jgi:hypothetical protein